MHIAHDRQLLAVGAALLLTAPLAVRGDNAVSEDRAQRELHATKLVESTVLGQSPGTEARETIRRTYAQLELKYPSDVAIKNAYGEFLWNIGERVQAITKWQAAAQMQPADGEALNHLGGAHLTIGEVRRAFDYFDRAVKHHPSRPLYRFNLANVAFMFRHQLPMPEEQAFEVARREFAEASRLAPENPEYARAYAEVFYALPKPDWTHALAAWKHFHDVTENKQFGLINMARVHLRLGNEPAAFACLSKVQDPQFQRIKATLLRRVSTRELPTSGQQKMPQTRH